MADTPSQSRSERSPKELADYLRGQFGAYLTKPEHYVSWELSAADWLTVIAALSERGTSELREAAAKLAENPGVFSCCRDGCRLAEAIRALPLPNERLESQGGKNV